MSTTLKRRHGRLNLKDEEDILEASNAALRDLESCRSVPASVILPSVINVASARQTSLPIGHQTHHSFRSLAHSESDDEEFGAERASMSTPSSEKARRCSTFGAASWVSRDEFFSIDLETLSSGIECPRRAGRQQFLVCKGSAPHTPTSRNGGRRDLKYYTHPP